MWMRRAIGWMVCGSLAVAPLAGCEDLPGSPESQGAVIGGVGGGLAGAAVAGEENRLIGALIGGVLGAGGGYLIGTNMDNFDEDDDEVREDAREAAQQAQTDPATVEDVYRASTADLNSDGFVTTDEVIALAQSDLTDDQVIDRLEATNQVFDLSPQQREYLRDNGVSQYVINEMAKINQDVREDLLRQRQDVLGSEVDEQM